MKNLTIEEAFKIRDSHPEIFEVIIWRLYPKKKDEFGQYYSTRIGIVCLN